MKLSYFMIHLKGTGQPQLNHPHVSGSLSDNLLKLQQQKCYEPACQQTDYHNHF